MTTVGVLILNSPYYLMGKICHF